MELGEVGFALFGELEGGGAEGEVVGLIEKKGAKFFGIGAAEEGGADGGVEMGEFGDGEAALIGIAFLFAEKALGEDAEEGAGDLVGFDAHFEEAGEGGGGFAGVEGGDEAVAGEGGLDSEGGGGGVADFAEHEDLGILAEDGLEGAVVGHLAVGGDFDLGDVGEEAFDGVFEGDDGESGVGGGDVFEEGVDGGGFSGAGGSGDEEHAGVGFGETVEGIEGVGREREVVEGLGLGEVGGEAEDGAEAVGDGDDGEAEVDGFRGWIGIEGGVDAAFLRDVEAIGEELGEDHEAEDGGAAEIEGKLLDGGEEPVDAEFDVKSGGGGFEVDVGGGGGEGAAEEGVDELGGVGGEDGVV